MIVYFDKNYLRTYLFLIVYMYFKNVCILDSFDSFLKILSMRFSIKREATYFLSQYKKLAIFGENQNLKSIILLINHNLREID